MLELPPLGLYVHIPWCVRKCPYCDFNSHERPDGGIPEAEYVKRLEADLERELARAQGLMISNGTESAPPVLPAVDGVDGTPIAPGVDGATDGTPTAAGADGNALMGHASSRTANGIPSAANGTPARLIQTIFFGGGTPSLFRPESFERLLEKLRMAGRLAPDAEITLEVNPGTAEAARFAGYRKAGINRLSLGVQSFDDGALARLGRIHGGAEACEAIAMARAAVFDNINIDLMFGLPGQQPGHALNDLETAMSFGPEHISWYQLTLEPNTVFWRRPPPLPKENSIDDMQEAGLDLLKRAGYARYEISAFALDGRQCRHNTNYWTFGDYLGIGAGAHGKLTDPDSGRILRTRKTRQPKHFLSPGDHTAVKEVPASARSLEFLMNALRLRTGFSADQFESRTGTSFGAVKEKIECLAARDLLEANGQFVRPTQRGYRLLDSILGEFA